MSTHPKDVQEKVRSTSDVGIKRVGEFLLNLELTPKLVDEDIYDGSNIIGNIDLAFELDNRLVLIEVSEQHKGRNEKILAWFQKWSNPHNVDLVQKKIGYHFPPKYFRIYIDLTRNSSNPELGPIPPNLKDADENNAILFRDDIEYFEDIFSKVRIFALYDLLSYLGMKPQQISYPIQAAIQFYLDEVFAISFVISADVLLRSAYVFRRRGQGTGYQRFLNFKKITAIEKKVLSGNILSFPNSVLINIEREVRMDARKPPEQCPAKCVVEFPMEYCSSRIIDGQHRLMGLARLPRDMRERISLQVIAFIQLSQDREVKTFVEINNNQTKVDKNLVLNLIGDFDWPPGSQEDSQKRAVVSARRLNDDHILNIFFGSADEHREDKVYLATLVAALLNNKLIGGRLDLWKGREYEQTSQVFLRIKDPAIRFPEQWRAFLLSNRGVRITFKLLYLLERNRLAGTTHLSNLRIIDMIREIASNDLLEKLTQSSFGLGGASQAVQEIVERLSKKFPHELGTFTTSLRVLRSWIPPLEPLSN